MAFVEDTSVFFQEFGVDVVWGGYSTKGILDRPGVGSLDFAVVPDFELTFETANLPGLGRGQTITVDGVTYTTQAPRALSDGKVSVVGLNKS